MLETPDWASAGLLLLIGGALLGPMLLLLWLRGRAFLRAMRRLRDRIDRSQRW